MGYIQKQTLKKAFVAGSLALIGHASAYDTGSIAGDDAIIVIQPTITPTTVAYSTPIAYNTPVATDCEGSSVAGDSTYAPYSKEEVVVTTSVLPDIVTLPEATETPCSDKGFVAGDTASAITIVTPTSEACPYGTAYHTPVVEGTATASVDATSIVVAQIATPTDLNDVSIGLLSGTDADDHSSAAALGASGLLSAAAALLASAFFI